MGFVELDHSRRLFYKWMHFTGGKTWITQDLTSALVASKVNFGEALFNELLLINNDALVTGKDVKLLWDIPSFVILNDNPQVGSAFAAFLQASLAHDKDWGRELYYVDKYGSRFFARYEEAYRDIYERLKHDPNINSEMLQGFWLANKHRRGFQEWQPNRYQSSSMTSELFEKWYARVTDPMFVQGAIYCFAEMWVGSSVVAEQTQTGNLQRLKEAGRFESLTDTLKFFDSFNRPLLPPHSTERVIRTAMKL